MNEFEKYYEFAIIGVPEFFEVHYLKIDNTTVFRIDAIGKKIESINDYGSELIDRMYEDVLYAFKTEHKYCSENSRLKMKIIADDWIMDTIFDMAYAKKNFPNKVEYFNKLCKRLSECTYDYN